MVFQSSLCAICLFIRVQRHSAGRNEAEVGKVTAPRSCCLDPQGLALWTEHCVFTEFQLCMCLCILPVYLCVSVCRLRSVKMEQRKLSDQANTLVDLSKVTHTRKHTRTHAADTLIGAFHFCRTHTLQTCSCCTSSLT